MSAPDRPRTRTFNIPLPADDLSVDGVRIAVRYAMERGEVTYFAATLVVLKGGEWHSVRTYDNRHGYPEMHRYSGRQRQPGERMPSTGNPNQDMAAALDDIKRIYKAVIG